jgi:hypothetical protein
MKTRAVPTNSSRLLLAGTLAFVALAPLSGCVSVEADFPDVQVVQRGIQFTGVPATAVQEGGGDVSTSRSYSQQHSKLELPGDIQPDVRAFAVMLRGTSGVADLSFIHYFRVTMSADGVAPVELGSYEPTPGAAVGPTIGLTTLNPIDVFDAWTTDQATFTLEIAGALPATDWTGDVIAHFSARARAAY